MGFTMGQHGVYVVGIPTAFWQCVSLVGDGSNFCPRLEDGRRVAYDVCQANVVIVDQLELFDIDNSKEGDDGRCTWEVGRHLGTDSLGNACWCQSRHSRYEWYSTYGCRPSSLTKAMRL